MTTIQVTLTAANAATLNNAIYACRFFSAKRVRGNMAVLTYILERGGVDDVMGDVDAAELDRLGVDVAIA